MNGFIKKIGIGTSAALLIGGCCRVQELIDPCWPERYNSQARHSVIETLAAQAHNGHVLDQTIWNWHFDPDVDPKTKQVAIDPETKRPRPSARLNPAGIEHLRYLARRLPCPDSHVFLQTAQDIPYEQGEADKILAKRAELDRQRQEAVHQFLTFATAGKGIDFQVQVIDPGEVGFAASPLGGQRQWLGTEGSVQKMYSNFQGGLQGGTGTTTSGTGSSTGGTSTGGTTGSSGTGTGTSR